MADDFNPLWAYNLTGNDDLISFMRAAMGEEFRVLRAEGSGKLMRSEMTARTQKERRLTMETTTMTMYGKLTKAEKRGMRQARKSEAKQADRELRHSNKEIKLMDNLTELGVLSQIFPNGAAYGVDHNVMFHLREGYRHSRQANKALHLSDSLSHLEMMKYHYGEAKRHGITINDTPKDTWLRLEDTDEVLAEGAQQPEPFVLVPIVVDTDGPCTVRAEGTGEAESSDGEGCSGGRDSPPHS